MSFRFFSFSLLLTICFFGQAAAQQNPLSGQRVLVFSKTAGFRHASIADGQKALFKMGQEYGFGVDTTENAAFFTEDNLKKYRAVIFLSTTGDVLNGPQQIAFERFIQAGGGYVGIHAAADTEYNWPWYAKLVGGYFASHPGNPNVQKGKMIVVNKNHPSTAFMDDTFERTDEFYDFKQFDPTVNVLVLVDEKSYKEGKMGDYHPMCWFREYDGGRSFYTNWGHTPETFTEPLFLKHLWGGLSWSVSGGALNYAKARSQNTPETNRFTRTVLDEKLNEPTELAVTNDGRVFFTERKGRVKLFDPKKGSVKVIAELDVYSKFEYGLMGINLDPDFDKNQQVYLFYSPPSGKPDTAQFLSRFVYNAAKEELDLTSEKVILRVAAKRDECCHTGGSIDWDKDGNLYLSTGDDTNPFASDGYAPIDNLEGRSGWDARFTSSNTNDLRGKILRIKPQPDGSYTIPQGNLFPPGTDKARPEIYVMGNRNPYRISVDKHTGYLYWGEVGPDAGDDSKKYGPRGHDEVNQARKAGYFGWPLFVADNRAYNRRDFKNNEVGEKFDPEHPLNESPHNTGLRELPPAQKAFIYYPYAESPEFGEVVSKGGRNAMAGPVYYSSDFEGVTNRFPDYYNGKFFAYDWMRDWINVVTMAPNGDFMSMERFLPNMTFYHPMDMQFGRDGALYMLEYGMNWFAQNDEARLTRIDYNPGNRRPETIAKASVSAGAAPLTVQFSSDGTLDYDGDPLRYEWTFAKGKKSKKPNVAFTFKKPGVYNPVLKVTDSKGNVVTKTLEVRVGNEPPKVEVAVKGNKTFYWNDKKVEYAVQVNDREDGSSSNGTIPAEEIQVAVDFLEGYDKTVLAQGHQQNLGVARGRRLIDLSDCKSCHAQEKKSIGPSYREIAKKYNGSFEIEGKLSDRIINGGGGVWGDQAMSAHPQISKNDAKEMVRYILSLGDEKKASKPLKDVVSTQDNGKPGTYTISANYTDKGNANNKMDVGTQSGSAVVTLRSAKFNTWDYDEQAATMKVNVAPLGDLLVATKHESYVAFDNIDLSGLKGFSVNALSSDDRTAGGRLELRLDAPGGPLIGSAEIVKSMMPRPYNIPFDKKQEGTHRLYMVFVNPNAGGKPLFVVTTASALPE
jgi:cytochrome c